MPKLGSEEELFLAERGFGVRIGFGRKPALLIIDMIVAFTTPQFNVGSELDQEMQNINSLLRCAHKSMVKVFFSTISYDDGDIADAGAWGLKHKAGVRSLKEGTAGTKLDPRLDTDSLDTVFVKKYASCFAGTNLAQRLTAHGIDTLIITGCTTSGCVRASAVDAIQLGFRPVVVREAVGDRVRGAHEQSLQDLQAKYADVVSQSEVLEYLRNLGESRHHSA